MATQFIWRKSIADNNYYCTQCGHLLIDKSGFPVGTGVTDADNPTELYCGKCGYGVAKIGYIDDSLMEMMGIEENRDKVNCLGDFQNFYDKLKQRADKLKKKEIEVNSTVSLKETYEMRIADLIKSYEERIEDIKDLCEARISDVHKCCDIRIADIKQNYEERIAELRQTGK